MYTPSKYNHGKKGFFKVALLASIITLSALAPCQTAQSAPDQQGAFTAQMFGYGSTQIGFGPKLATRATINVTKNVSFNWKTKVPNAAAVKWAVTDSPKGKALATGIVNGAPAPGQIGTFEIDFSKFTATEPPATAKLYFVRVIPLDAKQQALALPSDSAEVVYVKLAK